MLNMGPQGLPFAPHDGQKTSKSRRFRNEGIPQGVGPSWLATAAVYIIVPSIGLEQKRAETYYFTSYTL